MITWEWTKKPVTPDEVLDAARTIPVTTGHRVTRNLTPNWAEARRYLNWGVAALDRGGDDGWDSAASWAKRAVCRQMDGILVNNHLGCRLGQNYKEKGGYLVKLGVPGVDLLKDLVIDPRNDIEHAYEIATEEQARRACGVTELFLRATDKEASSPAVVALGWCVGWSERLSTKPGNEYHIVDLQMSNAATPMLLMDAISVPPVVLVLYPKDESLSVCPLKDFSADRVITLNARLRECLKSENYSGRPLDGVYMRMVKEQLKL